MVYLIVKVVLSNLQIIKFSGIMFRFHRNVSMAFHKSIDITWFGCRGIENRDRNIIGLSSSFKSNNRTQILTFRSLVPVNRYPNTFFFFKSTYLFCFKINNILILSTQLSKFRGVTCKSSGEVPNFSISTYIL